MEPTLRPRFSKRALEAFVVFAIVALISGVVYSFIASSLAESRDTRRVADVAEIRKALQHYYAEHGAYPSTGWVNSSSSSWERLASALAPYLSALPTDPKNDPSGPVERTDTFNYTYYSADIQNGVGGRRNYFLIFRLERPDDAPRLGESALSFEDITRLFRLPNVAHKEEIVVMSAPGR